MHNHPNLRWGLLTAVLFVGCSLVSNLSPPEAEVEKKGDSIFIVDRTGKKWDVTYAVENYGFTASEFQYGLGPHAIRPINNPKMLTRGDAGYPTDNQSFLIVGASIDGDTRAYPLSTMQRHEIANERFGANNTLVAVGY